MNRADAAWAMDGRGMDSAGEATSLQYGDIQRHQWHHRRTLDRCQRGAAQLHVWYRAEWRVMCASRCVHISPRLAVRDARECSQLQFRRNSSF